MTSKLAGKVHLAAAAAGAVGLLVIAGAAFVTDGRLVHQELRTRAQLTMSAFDADLHYTQTQVVPLLQRQLGIQFVPQAVPFYAASRASGFDSEGNRETLRVPTTNPTNEADKPSEWEAGIIKVFAEKPDLRELESERQTEAGKSFALSQPIVAEPACLSCHGDPKDAPRSLVQVYGQANGFGWKRGDVVGAAVVSIPEADTRRHMLTTIAAFAAVAGLVLVGILGVLDCLVQIAIVRPLVRLADYAGNVSLGMADSVRPNAVGADAIRSLAKAFDRMRNSLAVAMRMLEQGT